MIGGYRLYSTIDYIFNTESSLAHPEIISKFEPAKTQNLNLDETAADLLKVYEAIYGTLFKNEPKSATE